MKTMLKKISSSNQSVCFFKRLIAYFIDWYIISVITIIPINLVYSIIYQQKNFTSSIAKLPLIPAIGVFLIGLLFSLLYLVYFPYKHNGQTIGKKIFSLKIIKNNQKQIDLKTLLMRNGIGLIVIEGAFYSCSIYFWELIDILSSASIATTALSLLSFISFISIMISLFNSKHQMLHDYLSKTYVVAIQK